MQIIQPHYHAIARTAQDYERMAMSGVVAVAEFIAAEARAGGLDLRITADRIRRQASSCLNQRARRPANSLLDTAKIRRIFGAMLPAWQDDARAVVTTLLTENLATPT